MINMSYELYITHIWVPFIGHKKMKTAVCCWHRTASGQLNDQMIPFYQQITHIFSWMILKGAPLKTLLQKMIFCSRELGKDESNLWGKTFFLVACCNLTLSFNEFLAGCCLWNILFLTLYFPICISRKTNVTRETS